MSATLSGRLVGSDRRVEVVIDGPQIVAVRELDDAGSRDPDVIAPGLIDLQVNGYNGIDFNAERLDVGAVLRAVSEQARLGVTSFCPTLISAPERRITDALAVIASARRAYPSVRHAIPCVHVEGPYISPEAGPRGAHDQACLRRPEIGELERWQRAAQGAVGLVTLAPELDGAIEYISAATAKGVIISIGHTAADRDQIAAAVRAGASMSTHLGNGCAPLLPRHANPIWPQLAEAGLSAAFIADGQHLPADMLNVMIAAKGHERSLLVSDSVSLAGMPPGRYHTPIGGEVELSPSRRLSLLSSGGALLAGSASSLADCVCWAVAGAGLPAADVFEMASANPWRVLAARHRRGREQSARGRVAAGGDADLIVFGPGVDRGRLRVRRVIVCGVLVYESGDGAADGQRG